MGPQIQEVPGEPLERPWVEGEELRNLDLFSSDTVPPCQLHEAEACRTGGSALPVPWPSTLEPSLLPRGPRVPSHAGSCPSCFWHFYLLRPKALGGSDLRVSRCVLKGGGRRRGLGPAVCTSPPTPSSQPRRAGRTVRPWPWAIIGSIPGQALVSGQNFGGWTSPLPGKPVCSLERQPQCFGC